MDQGINEPSKNFLRCIFHNAYVMIQGREHSILVYLLLMVPDNAWLKKHLVQVWGKYFSLIGRAFIFEYIFF